MIKPELLHEVGDEHNHWKRGREMEERRGQSIRRIINVDTEITQILILRVLCWRR